METRKPYGATVGAAMCCALTVVGLLLQLTVGPVQWEKMAWPVNLIVLIVMLFSLLVMHLLRGKVRLFHWMSTLQAGVPAMIACAMLTVLMGVTRQVPAGHQPTEPIGITDMLSFWPFVLAYLWLILLVGMVTLTRLWSPKSLPRPLQRRGESSEKPSHLGKEKVGEQEENVGARPLSSPLLSRGRGRLPFILNHLGLFMALVCGALGSADMQRLHMMVREGTTEWRAVDERHQVKELPIAIELHDFSIQHEPRLSYKSDVTVYTKSGLVRRDTIQVNRPMAVKGWKIYQYSYDEGMEQEADISVFELVKDPWLPFVYTGIFMMLAGALAGLFGLRDNRNSLPRASQEREKLNAK